MPKPKYDLETLRKKCGGYGNVGIGARQFEFVFQQYDVEKARADDAEKQTSTLQNRIVWLAKCLAALDNKCPLNVLGYTPCGWICHKSNQTPCTHDQAADCWQTVSIIVAGGSNV